MTLIMRVKEERRESKAACTGPPLSTGAAPILFQTEVIVTPTEGRRAEGRDEVTGGQDPSAPLWLDNGLLLPG